MSASLQTRTALDSVALTFDDGPSEWTPVVLGQLARVGAHGTFFVNPSEKLEAIQEIAAAGHTVEYHCGVHVRHSERLEADVRDEAGRDLEALACLGIHPRAWRTPWGDRAPWSEGLASDLGLELWHWSDDTHDWDGRGAERMLADLEETIAPGAVVLMHDGVGPGARRTDISTTIDLIAPLVSLCRERGLEPGQLVTRELARV